MQPEQKTVCGRAIWFCVVTMAALAAVRASAAQAVEDTNVVSEVGVVSPFLNARVLLQQPAFTALSVDSLGLGKAPANSVRAPQAIKQKFSPKYSQDKPVWVEYRRPGAAETTPPLWRFELYDNEIRMISHWDAANTPEPVTFQFNPRMCHPTLLGVIDTDGSVRLPAVLHFPDQGSFRITSTSGKNVRLGYDAWRPNWVDGRNGNISVTFPGAKADQPRIEYRWEVAAIHPPVAAIEQESRFNGFRRNWLNSLQLNPRQRVLANHASSDNCAFCIYKYADIARHSPPLAEGLSTLAMIRQTLDRVLGGMASFGMPGAPSTSYPEPTSDTYPSLLIAAREYVAGSGDAAWLAKNYDGLKAWTQKMLANRPVAATAARLVTGLPGSALAGRDSHPLDDFSDFQKASPSLLPVRPGFPDRYPCLVTRPESYDKGLLLATDVTPLYSTRTEFSGGRHKGQQPISDWPLDDTRICS